MNISPLRYNSAFEHAEENEQQIAAELVETMLGISRKTYEDTDHAMRSVHVKSYAILQGELTVVEGLAPEFAQGLFAHTGIYPVIMRFSATPGDFLPDSVSTPRGLAVKIVGVKGERLPGSEGAATQDFVMVNNGPAFQNRDAKSFLSDLKMLAATTGKGEGAKKALSAVLRTAEKAIEAVGGGSGKIRGMGGEPPTHPLGETYFTQVPMLYGEYMAKLSLAPASGALHLLKGKAIDVSKSPTAVRETMQAFFAVQGGEWEVRIQLCTDLKSMPIEDASAVWPEDKSPYVTVARLRVPPQPAWSEARSAAVDDGMSFSPWHGLADHRPIGSIMRVRKIAYEMSSKFRAARNGKAMKEPETLDGLFPDMR